jgi:ATP/maltotriose-dependent transcriptional regulator MalT
MRTLAVPRRHLQPEPAAEPVSPGRLRPPPLRVGVIERPHLLQRLEKLARRPLTVVAAPTGFGKTTLLAAWAATTDRQVAWASVASPGLDADGFWTLMSAALGQAEPELRFGLRSARHAGDRAVATAAALGPLSSDLTVVLDGYEHATRAGVDAGFSRFLDLAPETLHVVVSTRVAPELALPLRRARGAVSELGGDDLRLDEAETAAVLEGTGLDAAAVAERTEGWPAGVYLGALARSSTGSREVSDYLRLELLDEQPDAELRSFLLETSLLERLTAPLCDAFLGRRDSEATLHTLARSGAFLVPGDGVRHEFRYLRPVREFLHAELLRVAPGRVAELHRRAAAACEREGLLDEATAHARAAGGDEQAASLLARHALELVRDGHVDHLESLLGTRAGVAAAEQRPALRGELRRLAEAGSDVPALRKAAERVATLTAGLPEGPVRALLQSTAQAAHAFALLLSGSVAEAYEAGAAAYAAAGAAGGAPAGQAAAVASLAASRLGLGAAAAPLARASASALSRRDVRSGTAALLADLAQAAVAEEQGDYRRAERLCLDAVERADEPVACALALLQLAGLRTTGPSAARAVLEDATEQLSRCEGAALLETLAAETKSRLHSREGVSPTATRELSPAEQRVLRLLATKLTQREVASELYVSLNTVKTHARVIYRKLGVDSRSAAVSAARDLNLV